MKNCGIHTMAVVSLNNTPENYHAHSIALLEGGVFTLSLIALVLAIANRQGVYFIVSIWLISNLQVGFIALGWDHHWLMTHTPPQWGELSRRLALVVHLLLSYALLNQLLHSNNKTLVFSLLPKLLYAAGSGLLVAAFFLQTELFNSALWYLVVASALGYLIVVALHLKAEDVATLKFWHYFLIASLGCLLLSCALMHATQFSSLVNLLNAVTVFFLSNLMVLLAVGSCMHNTRQTRLYFQRARISEAISELRRMADHDPITKILNQRGTKKSIATAIARAESGENSVLAYLNLNYAKYINGTYNHGYSDPLLRAVSNRIATLLAADHLLGHLNVDDFIIIFNNTPTAEAYHKAEQIIALLNQHTLYISNRSINLQSAIGLVEISPHAKVVELLSVANSACKDAMYEHKAVVLYERNSQALRNHLEILQLLKNLENHIPRGFHLKMQAIMSLQKPLNNLSFEVLLHVNNSQGSTIPAGKVIAAAEETGMISIIDKWVFTTSLKWLETHHLQLKTLQHLNINVSGVSLNDDRFIKDLFVTLDKYEHLCKHLCIEITESVALQNLERTRHFMQRLQAKGICIALDDFGAGYTSFSYLQELPADFIKIDGTLIKNILKKDKNIAIVRTITELAHNLGMRSIAEWAEDTETLALLRHLKVDYVQGWIISKAISPDKVLDITDVHDLITQNSVVEFLNEPFH